MKLKTIFSMLLLSQILCFLPLAAARNEQVLPVTGTWLNLAYQDVRNKYTNPQFFDNTDPELWAQKIRELSDLGIEYLVFMAVANEGEAYYPSQVMPRIYPKDRKSPVDAIMDVAAERGMKVFLSTGWAKDQDDNLRDPFIKQRQLAIMDELAVLYKNHKAFYGWYLPVEDCLCPILEQHAVEAVNALCERARHLTPGKKTMISPYGMGDSDYDNPAYEQQLAKLSVDIIAYQDEIGCKREVFPMVRIKENWKRLRAIHDKLNIELWANCELFTWEKELNNRESALIPAAFPRVLSQLTVASEAGVDKIISFMVCGIWEDRNSPYELGQPVWSAKIREDYQNWMQRTGRWGNLEKSMSGVLVNEGSPTMIQDDTHKALFDGEVADEDSANERWIKFEPGYHEILVDLGSTKNLSQVMLRMLNFQKGNIQFPDKIYLFTSDNGRDFKLQAIQNPDLFANTQHDAWIDGVQFEPKAVTRYLKVCFRAENPVYADELYIISERDSFTQNH